MITTCSIGDPAIRLVDRVRDAPRSPADAFPPVGYTPTTAIATAVTATTPLTHPAAFTVPGHSHTLLHHQHRGHISSADLQSMRPGRARTSRQSSPKGTRLDDVLAGHRGWP